MVNSEAFPIQKTLEGACSICTALHQGVKGWNGLSSGPRVSFLQEPCANGAVMQWPSWANVISTIHFLWIKCLWKLITDEVIRNKSVVFRFCIYLNLERRFCAIKTNFIYCNFKSGFFN